MWGVYKETPENTVSGVKPLLYEIIIAQSAGICKKKLGKHYNLEAVPIGFAFWVSSKFRREQQSGDWKAFITPLPG
ncbi:hypothetical protein D7X94_03975 [Acutalibacter sp. 1XD8-33]|nr:hypothetical protein D7X94_03975 [Acutalibacter sp. 1XD8-33]